MKKAIVILILFAILAITFTATMISIKKNEKISSSPLPAPTSNNPVQTNTGKANNQYLYNYEKTLDVLSTFDEPSVEFEEVEFNLGNDIGTKKIPQLKGLKEKAVQNKINEDIKNRFEEKIRENPNIPTRFVVQGKLPNVISACIYFTDEYRATQDVALYLNYELVTGERLHLEDLFVKDFDISLITSNVIKNWLENNNNLEYRDDEKHITEAEIIRRYAYWEKHKDDFFFNRVGIMHDEKYYEFQPYTIEFDSIPESVVIYDKYKTKESIYENEELGKKDILVCFRNEHLGDYSKTYLDDNLFFDYAIGYEHIAAFSSHALDTIEFPISGVVEKIEEQFLNKTLEELEKYKELAQNTEYGYFVSVYGCISPRKEVSIYMYDTDESTGLSSVLTCGLNAKVIKINKEEFKKELPKIIEKYNTDIWYGPYEMLDNLETYEVEKIHLDGFYYNAANDQYYNSQEEVEGETVLCPILGSYEGKLLPYDDDGYYTEHIMMLLEELSDDTLNKMYNEIFARHGHDFKSQELKDYFSLFDWYKPIEGKTVTMDELSDNEKENVELLKKIINGRK